MKTKKPILRCSFCGKSQSEVKNLIAGPNVYICNECVSIGSAAIQASFTNSALPKKQNEDVQPVKPHEIYKKLNEYVI